MNNLTIGKRIAFGFTIVLVLVTILAAVAVVSLRTIHKTLPMVTEESLPGVANMGTLDVLRSDIELDCARFLLVTKVEDKQTLEAELQVKEQTATKAMNDYEATIHQEEDRQNFKQLQEAFGNWTKAIPSLFELSRAGKPTTITGPRCWFPLTRPPRRLVTRCSNGTWTMGSLERLKLIMSSARPA